MAGVPDQRGRPVPQGLDGRRAARQPDRLTTPLVRDRGTGGCGRRRWDEALDLSPTRLARAPGGARPRRGRRLRRRRADQREGLPARQVRPGRAAAPARSTTTAGSACRRRRRPATGPSGSTAGCRSRWPTSARPTCSSCVGTNLAETMPPAARHLDAAPRARRARRRDRPAASPPTAERRRRVPAAGARHRPRARRSACCTWSSPAGAVDEAYVAARTTGFDDVRRSVAAWWPERVERVTGVAVGRAASRSPTCSAGVARGRWC